MIIVVIRGGVKNVPFSNNFQLQKLILYGHRGIVPRRIDTFGRVGITLFQTVFFLLKK